MWLKRNWGGEVKNVSVLIAVGVNAEGYREVLAVAEGSKEDEASWEGFLRGLKERGLAGVRLFVSDMHSAMATNAAAERDTEVTIQDEACAEDGIPRARPLLPRRAPLR